MVRGTNFLFDVQDCTRKTAATPDHAIQVQLVICENQNRISWKEYKSCLNPTKQSFVVCSKRFGTRVSCRWQTSSSALVILTMMLRRQMWGADQRARRKGRPSIAMRSRISA